MREKYWWLNEESEQVLNRGYLLKGETVEGAIDRITTAASKKLYKPELKDEFKEIIERGWLSLSSPIWANMGTKRGLPISCFNVHIPDSVEGITHKLGEVIMQTKIGGGTSGCFSELRGRGAAITDNGKSSGAVSFMKLYDSAMDVVSQGACYQEGTKVLTQRGYVDFREVKETDLLAQVDEYNNVSFTKDYELVVNPFKGELVKIKGIKRDSLVNIGVTPNHRMVIERTGGGKNNKHWKGYTEIVKAEDLRLHRDNRMFFSGCTEVVGRGLNDEERFMIAHQADGRKCHTTKNTRFRFSKERKINRFKELIESLNLDFTLNYYGDVAEFNVKDVEHLKKDTLSWVTLEDKSLQWCLEFLEEVSNWDGSKNKNKTSFSYSSVDKDCIDIIQAISSICGKRSRITKELRGGNRSDLYIISISDKSQMQGDSCEIYREHYDGKVYCAVVPKGRLIVNYEGRTLVCGNTRRGAFAAYLDIDHPDIEEFLQIKDIGSPIQNLFTGVCVPDYWMQDMIDGDSDKRKIWARVLESRQQKGLPYIFFTDNVNRNKPEIYKELGLSINASNLCSEITLPSSEDESFICCLASMNLELWDEWKDTNAVRLAIYFLDAVISEFIEKTEDNYYLQGARNFAIRHRALGLGVLGWHSYLQSIGRSFGHPLNIGLTNTIFSKISSEANEASKELGIIYGYAPIFNESKNPEIEKRRNTTLMAIAPTTSSSSILGQVSAGIEPYSSNYYKAGLAKGNFMRKNKYLQELLESKGLDNEETWRQIMLDKGSVVNVEGLTPDEKDIFKTFKEISQADILKQAAHRQKFIDQSQSLNINIPSEVSVKDVNRLIIEAWRDGVKTLYYQRSSSVSKDLVTNIINCSSCEA